MVLISKAKTIAYASKQQTVTLPVCEQQRWEHDASSRYLGGRERGGGFLAQVYCMPTVMFGPLEFEFAIRIDVVGEEME